MIRDTHGKITQDNEPLTFISLAALTANVTRWLEPTEKQKEQRDRETGGCSEDKKRTEEEAKYIEHRLREIAAWERRVNGGRKA